MDRISVRVVGECPNGHVVHVEDSTEFDLSFIPDGEIKRLKGRNKKRLDRQHITDHQCHEALVIEVGT